ncbi:zinc-binding alcohol dehydrogenase [Roseibacterium sp. SDUM158017]|uniref:zinc-dependent alcohol dehydrogenase n=1 Tax=Roseicyclus salinarum TaxID=3036773 RepID=UPI0024150E83|nr:zinc-binding alcohol dehydrogenase [Roseibacterium sp. SDUM158017]MDG4648689.1 zinc-binding alcohol dehydrogenase [Roseibacterium sp. SDUM158017]
MTTAPALWCVGPGRVETRPGAMGEGVAVDMLFSGISRGTERLVFEGRVPATEHDRMRGPAMEGEFPFPVKYGYCAVGRVTEGALAGRAVFALHPHQARFRLPEAGLTPLPDGLPPERAVLGANMETALTLLWDSGAGPGDRIAVIGAGVVGALAGYLAARLPGAEVTLVDTNPGRAALAETLGCRFADPDAAPRDCDVVVHVSASAPGLATAIACAGQDATVVEGSWHGAGATPVPLGGTFHSRRLRLVGSQVGRIPPARAPRWTYARRMAKALDLLTAPALDALISGETQFSDLPDRYGAILSDPATLCHRIRYD